MRLVLKPYDFNRGWELILDLGTGRLSWAIRQWKRRKVRKASREYESEEQYLDRLGL